MVEPIFDYQFRLILIGDSTVGKSSLLKYFTDGKFAEVSYRVRVIEVRPSQRLKNFSCRTLRLV
jgi:GTPase SAR1 family protein